MEDNSTSPSKIVSFNQTIRLINLILSSTGIASNLILLIILFCLRRQRCTTYFILILMSICDFLYCAVYTSILLTIDSYLNVINHQILCPLSFFLTPFTFTGSTLLLFICLLHLITNYIRRYDTILGQIGGRLSVVFVFAFVIVRSVLGSTSIELISDLSSPHIQYCTVDMNTPEIVTKIQTINHIFAEVTDILVYIGWIILFCLYFFSSIPRRKPPRTTVRFLTENKSSQENEDFINNKQRHHDVSLIILSISIISIIFYFPVMINKFLTMTMMYFRPAFLNDPQIFILHVIQQTMHLFCLTIRCLPYIFFDRNIRALIHPIIGMKIQREKFANRYQKYMCSCRCSQRRSFQLNENQQKQIEV